MGKDAATRERESQKESPVFFDQTGRRWKKAKIFFGALFVVLFGGAAVLLPILAAPVDLPGLHADSKPSVKSLEAEYDSQNTPILGSGQLIRAVEIKQKDDRPAAHDVFTGEFVRHLTEDEIMAAGNASYALLRYGEMPDKHLMLTFDDGPDPMYTPELLSLLSEHEAQSAFFIVGANVVKHPEIARRMVREGHTLGNHTFTHLNFDYGTSLQGEQEMNQTERVTIAATGQKTSLARVPYAGATDQSLRVSIRGILESQRLGYVLMAYDYDTRDWTFDSNRRPDPSIFDGSGKILLLHDSGGDRSFTVNYVQQLIDQAKKAGYTFSSPEQIFPELNFMTEVEPSFADKTSFWIARAFLVLPGNLMLGLFAFNVGLILLVTGINITLAFLQRRRARRVPPAPRSFRPKVSVVVPAFNEADVLEGSVRSVLTSDYRKLEVIIVDDGSRDDTFKEAKRLAAQSRRVKAFRQANSGKAAALNNGIARSSGEIVICIDADTLFVKDTVRQLVRHFRDPKVGGVAGYVRAGNIRNWLTRWQALEYITSIGLERGAQAFMGSITVVPGACGAWRREALAAAGGFSDSTLAEDCDVALSIHEAGYKIVQDVTATSYTECPLTLADLAKQRFRWTFGNIQSFWKHRRMFFRKKYGWLGMLVLPNSALSVLLPMAFWPLLLGVTTANVLAGRWWVVALFFGLVVAVQFFVALAGLLVAGEKLRHLAVAPLTRLVYGPLRTYILYRSLLAVLRGALVGWNKVNRTSTVKAPEHVRSFQAVRRPAEE